MTTNSPIDRNAVLRLYREGKEPTEIARSLACHPRAIDLILRDAGVTRRRTAAFVRLRALAQARAGEIRVLWAQGASRKELGSELGITAAEASTIVFLLALPPRGGRLSEDGRLEAIVEGRQQGQKWAAIGREVGLTAQAAQQRWKRARRRRGERG